MKTDDRETIAARPAPQQTPAAAGYRMPAEWAPHQGTWLSWPHNPDTWVDKLDAVERVMAEAVRALADGETVHINVLDDDHAAHVRSLLAPDVPPDRVLLHPFPTNDSWCRDHGAVFVVRDDRAPHLLAVDWGYNAWGGKYPPYDLDDAIPQHMARFLGVPCLQGGMILEGGSIEVNGAGLLLTTEACLLNPNRNPDLTRDDIERRLRDLLGVRTLYWLVGEMAGDDTDGHIDNLARFVAEDRVVAVVEPDPDEDNYAPLQENLARLRAMTTPEGRPLRIETLPMPAPLYERGMRMPASYANFYIGNRVVLMPAYRGPNDAVARDVLQALFPTRRVVALDCTDVIWGLGAFHCLTQQVPAV